MHTPYTDSFPEAVALAAGCTGVALTAAIGSHALRSRVATLGLVAAVWVAAAVPLAGEASPVERLGILLILQSSATLATLSIVFGQRLRWLKLLAIVGQGLLFALTCYVAQSNDELAFAHLCWCGLLLGLSPDTSAQGLDHRGLPPSDRFVRSLARQDWILFLVTTLLTLAVTCSVFERHIFNGDEVAYSYQADVYAHLRAYGPIPACASMFENCWVFRHEGRAFSQYTPGWPLFMAPFSRLGVIYLAGPVMSGIVAVAVARLSRRLVSGLGASVDVSERITRIAGVLGAGSAMLGPSMLLNGASRFSHTMVCGCFGWAVESVCIVTGGEVTRRRAWAYGLLLGSATALGLATRPADGATLGVGIFLYFCWALYRRRVTAGAFAGTTIGFALFGGLTALILRLQLGVWFHTAYSLAPFFHPDAQFVLSAPAASQIKLSVPLATGSYCWWPAAPALGVAGLARALFGRERRLSFVLICSGLAFAGFYYFVEFGRFRDDGLGPRYLLPLVLPMAIGGAALLAPVVERLFRLAWQPPLAWLSAAPAGLIFLALVCGTIQIAPLVYPVARAESHYSTAPFRGADKLGLKHAVVMIEHPRSTADAWNLAQNEPMNPNPDVLFLWRRTPADDACVRQNFPGRSWYRAGFDDTLPPW